MKSHKKRHRYNSALYGFTSESYFNLGQYEMKCPQGNRYDKNTTSSAAQDTSARYGSQLVTLDVSPKAMTNPKNGSQYSCRRTDWVSTCQREWDAKMLIFHDGNYRNMLVICKTGRPKCSATAGWGDTWSNIRSGYFQKLVKSMKIREDVSCKCTK